MLLTSLVTCQAAIIPATTLIRAPNHDSAIIHSDRLGGNFAYFVQEGHAYVAISPVIQNVVTPIGVTYPAPVLVTVPYFPYYPASNAFEVELPAEHREES